MSIQDNWCKQGRKHEQRKSAKHLVVNIPWKSGAKRIKTNSADTFKTWKKHANEIKSKTPLNQICSEIVPTKIEDIFK